MCIYLGGHFLCSNFKTLLFYETSAEAIYFVYGLSLTIASNHQTFVSDFIGPLILYYIGWEGAIYHKFPVCT